MAVVDYTPQINVEWLQKANRKMILRQLDGLKPEILDAALWVERKHNRCRRTVTLWFNQVDTLGHYAVEICIAPEEGIVANLVDYVEDVEVGRIHLKPLLS